MKINVVTTASLDILHQLQLEEALLRSDQENWCIINSGSRPCIVLGSNDLPDQMIHQEKAVCQNLQIVKRFSAGGTVVVDHNTLFVSFIFNSHHHDFHPFPEPILRWTEKFYQKALHLHDFSLKENDYTIGAHKIGGNAQYLKKNRWLHHSTFLYDYNPLLMDCLQQPKKRPAYRGSRDHADFITTLKKHTFSKNNFIKGIQKELEKQFHATTVEVHTLKNKEFKEHRKSTYTINLAETL